jgi:peptide/nickel transport system permease protein
MTRYAATRVAQAILSLIAVSVVIFLLMKLYPGDPGSILLGRQATPAKVRALDRMLGLDLGWPQQYLVWLRLLFAGGLSGAFGALPSTLLLLALGGGLGLAISMSVAIRQARFPGSWLDRITSFLAQLFYAFPSFWLAELLYWWLGMELGWIPLVPPGYLGNQGLGDWALYMSIPVLTVALTTVAGWSIHLRAAMEESLLSDYVRTARAKGQTERLVIRRHVVRNSVLPLLSILGMSFPVLLSNLMVVQAYMGVQGIGGALMGALFTRAYGTVLNLVMVVGIVTVALNLLTDLLSAAADPRIRFG